MLKVMIESKMGEDAIHGESIQRKDHKLPGHEAGEKKLNA